MTQETEKLRRKIRSAAELNSVVKTMKNWAAVSIGSYAKAVEALSDYYRTVELGLVACLRQFGPLLERQTDHTSGPVGVVVFGSDQGMVGQFNEQLADFVLKELKSATNRIIVWPVGECIGTKLMDADLPLEPIRHVPDSVTSITPLVGQILLEIEAKREHGDVGQVLLFHNRPDPRAGYESVCQRLLPLDHQWVRDLRAKRWPTPLLPQVRREAEETFAALIREYLFISIFRACAESLASENESRLAAMQGAEENIKKLQEQLQASFNQTRQSSIDEELFDVIAGFEALRKDPGNR
jgi:F-type H+-transporting ATPase subunit gamma